MENLTICIPSYNRLGMLKDLVNSIPEEYPVCISDNGNYVPDNSFCRGNIRIHHFESVVSSGDNWNRAVSLVETDWFILPGDDDIIFPHMLPRVMESIKKYPDCGIIVFGYNIINEKSESKLGWCPSEEIYLPVPQSFYNMKRHIPFRWPAFAINTKKSKEIGDFDQGPFQITAGDSYYLQYLAIKNPVALIPEVIGEYRIWGNNTTITKLFSTQWFKDVKLWQDKLKDLLQQENIQFVGFNKNRDLILSDNLIAALNSAKNAGLVEKLKFAKQVGIPYRAGLLNIARIVRAILR